MCGIVAKLVKETHVETFELMDSTDKIKHRGPDNTMYNFVKVTDEKTLYLGFTRLSINGLDDGSNQPFFIDDVYLICNGEIYNYKELISEHNFNYHTNSDCEVIIHMYRKLGIHETVKRLDGVFAFVMYDKRHDILYAARDPLGIRSLYFCFDGDHKYFASELKCFSRKSVYQFPPGTFYNSRAFGFVYYTDILSGGCLTSYETISETIRDTLIKSVKKRLLSDRPIACLLSGGLDSTLVTTLVRELLGKKIDTYAIGLKGSIDLHYAKLAAEYINTNHTTIELTEQEFIGAIEKTIKQIESWDTTTVRASVGNYLVSLYVAEHSDNKVLFCGDVSDELFGSYRGFKNAPDSQAFGSANVDMVQNVYKYDVLRSDKCISGAGLEARVPFADKEFVKLVMQISPEYKMFNDEQIEKFLLRRAFNGYLPDDLLWRRKEAFSDGVSSEARSWFQIIKEFVDTLYTDAEFAEKVKKYTVNPPYDKESLYYRELFCKYYPDNEDSVTGYWKQPFSTNLDPSAWLID